MIYFAVELIITAILMNKKAKSIFIKCPKLRSIYGVGQPQNFQELNKPIVCLALENFVVDVFRDVSSLIINQCDPRHLWRTLYVCQPPSASKRMFTNYPI